MLFIVGARNVSHRGREFYVGFLKQHPSANPSEPFIFVSTYDQRANFTIYNRLYRITSGYTLAPYSSIKIRQLLMMENSASGVTSKILHILSDQDIKVTTYQRYSGTAGGALILPIPFYGFRYVIAMYNALINGKLLVIASESTMVKIYFSKSVIYLGRSYSRSRPLMLFVSKSLGFYYQYKADLTGTVIESNAPVAVIAGNQCTNVPIGTRFCDLTISQFPPISTLGRKYILAAFSGRTANSLYRVVAAHASTKVIITSISQTVDLNLKGSYLEYIFDVVSMGCHIRFHSMRKF